MAPAVALLNIWHPLVYTTSCGLINALLYGPRFDASEDLPGAIATRQAADPATRMGARATQKQAAHRHAIVRVPDHRTQ